MVTRSRTRLVLQRSFWIACVFTLAGPVAWAQQVYMRTDKDGKVTFSNAPTGAGYTERQGSAGKTAPPPAASASQSNTTALAARPPAEPSGPQVAGLTDVAAGYGFTLGVDGSGTLWLWGMQPAGRRRELSVAEPLMTVTNVKSVSARQHAVVVRQDGTVWTWGNNQTWQLGDEGPHRDTPMQVQGIDRVTAVSAGSSHTLALRSDGTVWGWGNNFVGQLGEGTSGRPKAAADVTDPVARLKIEAGLQREKRAAPGQVKNLDRARAIAACEMHSLAVRDDGTVWAWGQNEKGQLGTGDTQNALLPVQVKAVTGAIKVACGRAFSLALTQTGEVWAWGENDQGQLGDAGLGVSLGTPTLVRGLSGAVAIAASPAGAAAVREDGTLWVWGRTDYIPSRLPVNKLTQVAGLEHVKRVSASGGRIVAMQEDGTLWAWGMDVAARTQATVPKRLPGEPAAAPRLARVSEQRVGELQSESYSDVKAGGASIIALDKRGTVWTWGNFLSRTGGQVVFQAPVPELKNVTAIAAGNGHAIALTGTGTVWSWGQNVASELAREGGDDLTPRAVDGLARVRAVAAGANHNVALASGGEVWTWGDNRYGQLGDGEAADRKPGPLGDPNAPRRAKPMPVKGLDRVIAIDARGQHNLALRQDGTVWAWGRGDAGQLGYATSGEYSATAHQVAGLSDVIAIAAGNLFSLALTRDGSVWGWGRNNEGQLGYKSTQPRVVPEKINGIGGVKAIAAGSGAAALRDDGTLWVWGPNHYYQIQAQPTQVTEIDHVKSIALGNAQSAALQDDGTLWTWGSPPGRSGERYDVSYRKPTRLVELAPPSKPASAVTAR